VNIDCGAVPVAVCKPLTIELSNTCTAEVAASAFDGGSTGVAGPLTYSVEPAGPYAVGVTNVVFTVTDQAGASSSCATTITVKDVVLPTIVEMENIVAHNDAGACVATITLEAPEVSDNCAIESITSDWVDEAFPVGETIVTWTVKDVNGNAATATQKVIVANDDPEITSLATSATTVAIGTPVEITTFFEDDDVSTATIDWGDGSPLVNVDGPQSGFEASHTYGENGTYQIAVTITDHCGASDSSVESIVVSDRQSGWVNGGGWYDSPRGAYIKDPRETGKVNFAFHAKSSKQGNIPVGTVTINFKAGKLKFRSSQLTSLTIDGSTAILKGTGSLNNKKGYNILISMVDDDSKTHGHHSHGKADKNSHKKKDRIRVRIWNSSGVIYDTQSGDADDVIAATKIGGGNIEVNNSGFGIRDAIEDLISHFGEESTSVYPNPFTDLLNIQFNSSSSQDVVIQLMDLTGKVIASNVYPVSDDGYYSLDIPENAHKGIYILTVRQYILTVRQGQRVDVLRLVCK
jgi:hypothetical protein